MKPGAGAAVTEWVQRATAVELAAFMGLAGSRLVSLLAEAGTGDRKAGPPPLVTIAAAAAATGMSSRWFYDHGEAPWMRRLGPRTYRVDLAALAASMEQHRG